SIEPRCRDTVKDSTARRYGDIGALLHLAAAVLQPLPERLTAALQPVLDRLYAGNREDSPAQLPQQHRAAGRGRRVRYQRPQVLEVDHCVTRHVVQTHRSYDVRRGVTEPRMEPRLP